MTSILGTPLLASAIQISIVRVSVPQARLWAQGSGKMIPLMSVPQGTALQVSEVSKGGWRQVVVREPNQPVRWGWVSEREITTANEASRAIVPVKDKKGGKNDSFILGFKAGYGLVLTSAGAVGYFIPALELGVQLLNDRAGDLYLELHGFGTRQTAVVESTGFYSQSTSSLTIVPQLFLTGRGLFQSGFYAGAGAGALFSSTSTTYADKGIVALGGTLPANESASLTAFNFGGILGYDIRPWPVFSFAPEIQYSGTVASGGFQSLILFLGTFRFHF